MTDETVHIQPAIPSRATLNQPRSGSVEQHQSGVHNALNAALPYPPSGAVERHPSGARIRRNAAGEVRPPKRKKKKAKALPAAEIKQINAKRKKNLKKAAAPAPKKRKAKRKPKNPNRPLEMKNQLSAVLSMVGTLQKAELVFFSQAVPAMQALSRSGRKRVIAALQQVYGG